MPPEVREHREEYGFIGRDGPILEIERALHRPPPAVLVQGLGGVGKTTLARGFLRWLDETGGLDGALWFDFRDIRTAEYVINRTGESFYGENFRLAPNKLELLRRALAERRALIVWDNFESATTNLTGDDRAELGRFLDAIRGCRGKVIVTSRSPEEWMKPSQRFALPLRGLDGEERWEYCETILRELGLKVDRNDPELSDLMKQLAGHPLAMRVVLPKLEQMPAGKIAETLRTNIAELALSEVEATLRLFEQGLAEDLRPLLALVGLHEGYIDANLFEDMAKQVDADWARERIDRCLVAMGVAGLVREIGAAIYEMHPLLTSYLRRNDGPEACQRAFVRVMASLAYKLTRRNSHEQRVPFLLHGANFCFAAVALAKRLSMDRDFGALNHFLAVYALWSRNFGEAFRLFENLARHHVARGDAKAEAEAYHQLGNIAFERRNFAAAREAYVKSLVILEKEGELHGAADIYFELGNVAQAERDFVAARELYFKSLGVSENEDDMLRAAPAYYELGTVAQDEGNFAAARDYYLKSLVISEKQSNLELVTLTCHELGNVARAQREFAAAREWCLKSLAISEKHGNAHYAAKTYNLLGLVAQEQRDFEGARQWYLKSLAICEQQGDLHAAAGSYGNLGIIAGLQGSLGDSGRWLVRCISSYLETNDLAPAERNIEALRLFHQQASPAEKQKVEAMWREAGLGDFPDETRE